VNVRIFADSAHEELFRKDGFVTIPLLSQEEISRLSSLWSTIAESASSAFYVTVCNSDAAYRHRVSSAIAEVVQPHVERHMPGYTTASEGFITKRRRDSSGGVPLHQDYTLVDLNRDLQVNMWCPLVDVNVDAGCLHFVAGSHSLRRHINAIPRNLSPQGYRNQPNPSPWDQVHEMLYKECSTPVPLKAGVCIFWHQGALHWSPPNNSDRERLCIGAVCHPQRSNLRLHIWDWNDPGRLELIDVHGPIDAVLTEIGNMQQPYPSHWKNAGSIDYPSPELLMPKDLEPLVVANRQSR
jgi:hypothetical protein